MKYGAQPRSKRRWGRGVMTPAGRVLPALLGILVGLALAATPAAAQPAPAPGTASVLDGPSGAILRPAGLGLSIARDGTGGLVYLKLVGGAAHVFVSRLAGGSFGAPVQVDTGLAGGSSEPVIAAGNAGLLLVGFINRGQLYAVDTGPLGQLGSPMALASGAENPAISITNFGKAYLAFATADRGGHDVRAAYYDNGSWALEAPPLNALSPADDAGTGAGRPAVAAAGDGVAVVVWGEHGHVYSRRMWGTAASVVDEQADAPLAGCTEGSSGNPAVGVGGESSYAPVAFRATLTCGGQQQSRVLVNRLHGSVYDGVTAADGSPGAGDGAADPRVAVGEYGSGWVTSARTTSDNAFAASLGSNGQFTGAIDAVNGLPAAQTTDPVPAIAGLRANLVAWQQQPGSAPGGDIRFRFAPDGVTLGPETVVSSPAQGATDATDGLAAAGDVFGEAAIAWLQGPTGATDLMVNQLYEPPGGFSPLSARAYARTSQPVLAWTRPPRWGPIRYTLSVDGVQMAQTYATSAQVPVPLSDGPHSWQLTATNPAGEQSRMPPDTVFVDTIAPTARLRLLGRAVARSPLQAVVRYRDRRPAGELAFDASGVAAVVVRWGDGSVVRLGLGRHRLAHTYRHPGRYQITVLVRDRAGNLTRLVRVLRVRRAGS